MHPLFLLNIYLHRITLHIKKNKTTCFKHAVLPNPEFVNCSISLSLVILMQSSLLACCRDWRSPILCFIVICSNSSAFRSMYLQIKTFNQFHENYLHLYIPQLPPFSHMHRGTKGEKLHKLVFSLMSQLLSEYPLSQTPPEPIYSSHHWSFLFNQEKCVEPSSLTNICKKKSTWCNAHTLQYTEKFKIKRRLLLCTSN